jgi:Transcriptional regulator
MLEISQLRCFVAVGEELHFRRAAERLNMTQPPLSRQIRLLEHQVGTPLLERTNRVVKFTAAGKAFFPEAARILRLAEEAASTARRVAKAQAGSITIGFTAAFGYGVLPEWVRRLQKRAPEVALGLKEMVTRDQVKALEAGEIDVGLLRPHAAHGAMQTLSLGRESLMLAVPRADAKKWPQRPTLASLNGKRLIGYSPYEAGYFHRLLQAHLERARVAPEYVTYVPQVHTMLALVDAGVGAAVVPAAATRLHFEHVVVRRLETVPAQPVEMALSYRKDNDNPVLAVFREEVATIRSSGLR